MLLLLLAGTKNISDLFFKYSMYVIQAKYKRSMLELVFGFSLVKNIYI